jgi:CRISPR-associated protein Cmr2
LDDGELVLLLGDVDAIKDYVFETSSLPQMRGGSQLLIDCEREVSAQVTEAGGGEIFCGGGSFLFEVPRERAPMLKEMIERVYLDTTGAATVTVVYENGRPPPYSGGPEDGWSGRLLRASGSQYPLDGGFAHRLAVLAGRLRAAKASKVTAPSFPAMPFGRRCAACGIRVAVRPDTGHAAESEPLALCDVCRKRHEAGVTGEGRTRGTFNEEFNRDIRPRSVQAPDLDHMVQCATRKYLALLYADGNSIGALLQSARTREHYRALSSALGVATKDALFGALSQVCAAPLSHPGYWPFEIVNVGGDDVVVLVQAGYAWELAIQFLERFERGVRNKIAETPGSSPVEITASCGLAIADARYPIRFLRGIAVDLLKDAKKLAKKSGSRPQSALTFLWLQNPVIVGAAEPLLARYRHEEFVLTARPYTLQQARELERLAREAAHWPGTRRHLWGEAIEHGIQVALNTIYYDIAGSRASERDQLYHFIGDVGRLFGTGTGAGTGQVPLWDMDTTEKVYRTALGDVLELAELQTLRPKIGRQVEKVS